MTEGAAGFEVVRLSLAQRQAAKFLTKSAAAAVHVTVFGEIDVTRLVAFRERMPDDGNRPGITDFTIAALARALRLHPQLNAHYVDGSFQVMKAINIGLAVSLDSGDLMTPVLRNVAAQSLGAISQDVKSLAGSARRGALKIADMHGAGFTISNIGQFRTAKFATPIIPAPQVAILAVTAIRPMPVVVNGGIEVASILPVSLGFDHRVINGVAANSFLDTLAAVLARPDGLTGAATDQEEG